MKNYKRQGRILRPCLLYTVLPLSTVLISCSKIAFCPSTVSTQAKSSAQNEHRAVRFRSCYFYYFLREYIDKTNKKVHNKFTNEYRHIQERGSRGAQRNGVRIPDAERHCKVYVFSDGAAARSLAGAGKALRKERAKAHAPSQDIRFRLFLAAFQPERMRVHKNVCTKV